MPECQYKVWVGGIEVNDYLLTEDEADELAEKYMLNGYDDVFIERVEVE